MRVYLDNCTFNRPFDDQSLIRNRLEAEAKLFIQDKIKSGLIELSWSYILEFENSENPFAHRREAIEPWRDLAIVNIAETPTLLHKAENLRARYALKPKDALHVASAVVSVASTFITTDDKILSKLNNYHEIEVLSPLEFINKYGEIK